MYILLLIFVSVSGVPGQEVPDAVRASDSDPPGNIRQSVFLYRAAPQAHAQGVFVCLSW